MYMQKDNFFCRKLNGVNKMPKRKAKKSKKKSKKRRK